MSRTSRSIAPALLGAVVAALALPASAQDVTQRFRLQPGWNAVYLSVQPTNGDPAAVFDGLPVLSAWRYAPSIASAEFLESQAEALVKQPGWLPWFPPTSPEAVVSRLLEIKAGIPYLVRLGGASAVDLSVTGQPVLTPLRWAPDAFTLTGFPVEEAEPATFSQFFEASAEHESGSDALLVYGLAPDGTWAPVLDSAMPIEAGKAYWVFTRGGSQHQGPFELTPPTGAGIDFSARAEELSLSVRRRSGPTTVSFKQVSGNVPLVYNALAEVEAANAEGVLETFCQVTWIPITGPLVLPRRPCSDGATPGSLATGQEVTLDLGVLRRDLATDRAASTLEVSNGQGVRWLVPVRVERRVSASAARVGGTPAASKFAGLWVGDVEIDAVTQSNVPVQDMSFDLQLAGVTDSTDSVGRPAKAHAVVLAPRSAWRYWHEGTEPRNDSSGDSWQESDYDDASVVGWAPGIGEFGFGDGTDGACSAPQGAACNTNEDCRDACEDDQNCQTAGVCQPDAVGTLLRSAPVVLDAEKPKRTPPAYFRSTAATPPRVCTAGDDGPPPGTPCESAAECGIGGACGTPVFDRLELSVLADDGAVVYLNGTPVARVNLPAANGSDFPLRPTGPVSGDSEGTYVQLVLDPVPAAFDPNGPNHVAVSVHQYEVEPALVDQAVPTPTASPFRFRLLVHMDRQGQARLLKDVIHMRDRVNPNEHVLVTVDERIPDFSGVSLVDGQSVGFRTTTAAFDFNCRGSFPTRYSTRCDPTTDSVRLDPVGGFGSELTTDVSDPWDAPTNPFVHRYHPDHDNEDAENRPVVDGNPSDEFDPDGAESFTVRRDITLRFSETDPELAGATNPTAPPGYGEDLWGGTYEETLRGLHRRDLDVRGTFRLRRVNAIAELQGVAQ